jgi:hypothetical protein
MMSMTRQYSAAASQASGVAEKAADLWTEGVRKVAARVPVVPQVDLVPAVERYFDLVQRAVDINRRLTVRWAQTAGTLSGVVGQQAQSAGEATRERAESVGDVVRQRAESFEQAADQQAARAAQTEKDLAAEARRAEREHARRSHNRARARYEGLTKAELSDLLAKRGLPKSGNVDELVERLVEADGK